MVGGELNQFDAIGGPHLIEDAREVRFDRVLADGRLLGNPPVAVPRHDGLTISISRCVKPNALLRRRVALSFLKLAPIVEVGPGPTHK